jgi:hypothetical protein
MADVARRCISFHRDTLDLSSRNVNKLSIYILSTLVLLAASSVTIAAETAPSEQVIVAIVLHETPSATGQKKILAEPTIVVTLGRPFSLHVGGELNPRIGGDVIEIGTRMHGTVSGHEDGSLLVSFKLAVGHQVIDARDPDMDLVQTEMFDLRTTMTIGQKKRVNCGRSQLLDIQVKPILTADDEP